MQNIVNTLTEVLITILLSINLLFKILISKFLNKKPFLYINLLNLLSTLFFSRLFKYLLLIFLEINIDKYPEINIIIPVI